MKFELDYKGLDSIINSLNTLNNVDIDDKIARIRSLEDKIDGLTFKISNDMYFGDNCYGKSVAVNIIGTLSTDDSVENFHFTLVSNNA